MNGFVDNVGEQGLDLASGKVRMFVGTMGVGSTLQLPFNPAVIILTSETANHFFKPYYNTETNMTSWNGILYMGYIQTRQDNTLIGWDISYNNGTFRITYHPSAPSDVTVICFG